MSDSNPIEGSQGQPEQSQYGKPRRFRREIPNYPQNPIIIPSERQEAARGFLGSVYELWKQGDHLKSLQRWFDAPIERRDDAINTVLLEKAKSDEDSLSIVQHDTRGKSENLIFEHYALLTTTAVGKIINPGADPITLDDVNELDDNPGQASGNNTFRTRLLSIGLGQRYYSHDADDFTKPRHDIVKNFNLEEAREFLLNLIPHIDPENELARKRLLSTWGIVSGIQHADLLTDPRLADDLERPILGEVDWVDHLENYLAQGIFPSAEFFEEAFRRLKPEDSNLRAVLKATVNSIRDTDIPASMYYFNMLRKITSLKKQREHDSEFGRGREEKIVSYLLSNAFMEHALPYLETENVYSDNFVSESSRIVFHHSDVEATGEGAREIKRKRFREVLQEAEEYLKQKGDTDTIQKLKDRKVAGVKFLDYWSTDNAA